MNQITETRQCLKHKEPIGRNRYDNEWHKGCYVGNIRKELCEIVIEKFNEKEGGEKQ